MKLVLGQAFTISFNYLHSYFSLLLVIKVFKSIYDFLFSLFCFWITFLLLIYVFFLFYEKEETMKRTFIINITFPHFNPNSLHHFIRLLFNCKRIFKRKVDELAWWFKYTYIYKDFSLIYSVHPATYINRYQLIAGTFEKRVSKWSY